MAGGLQRRGASLVAGLVCSGSASLPIRRAEPTAALGTVSSSEVLKGSKDWRARVHSKIHQACARVYRSTDTVLVCTMDSQFLGSAKRFSTKSTRQKHGLGDRLGCWLLVFLLAGSNAFDRGVLGLGSCSNASLLDMQCNCPRAF